MSHIVILGAGTGGTIMANRLRRTYAAEVRRGATTITVVDPDEAHVYQPGLLFLPFGKYTPEQLVRPRKAQIHRQVRVVRDSVDRVVAAQNAVQLTSGARLDYDVLIVASGSRVVPEETEGLTGPGWGKTTHQFYTLDGATRLRDALARFQGGRVVIDVVDMPIKCPVAPLELAFLADAYFTKRGIRDRVELTYVTPLDGAFTKATCSRELTHLLHDKHISLVSEFSAGRVDGTAGTLYSWDEREVPFDLLITIPVHMGAEFVSRSSGLGDDMGFVRTDPNTLQAKVSPNVFAIGDATNLPASKAGSVVHFEAEVLTENVRRFLAGAPLEPAYDGHSNCFIETGFEKALLIDFNYEIEPVSGHFPFAFGPMRLLHESRLNHLGKLGFRWFYWHVLLPGFDVPAIGPRMPLRGKDLPPRQATPPRTPTPPAELAAR